MTTARPDLANPERPPEAPAHPLDNPAYGALAGPHARFAERHGRVLRYQLDVSPWLALPDDPGPDDWADLARLAGPGAEVPAARRPGGAAGRVGGHLRPARASNWSTSAWPPRRTRRRCRSAPPTYRRCWTWSNAPSRAPSCRAPSSSAPTSAYAGAARSSRWPGSGCTRRAGRRSARSAPTRPTAAQGLATRLVLAVAAGIRARGETPFLHTAARNTDAIRLYESLGFRLRRRTRFLSARVPSEALAPEKEKTSRALH